MTCIWSSWCHCHPHHPSSLLQQKSRMVCASGNGLPRFSWKRPLNEYLYRASDLWCSGYGLWLKHNWLWTTHLHTVSSLSKSIYDPTIVVLFSFILSLLSQFCIFVVRYFYILVLLFFSIFMALNGLLCTDVPLRNCSLTLGIGQKMVMLCRGKVTLVWHHANNSPETHFCADGMCKREMIRKFL